MAALAEASKFLKIGLILATMVSAWAWAGVDGSISGTVTDPQGIAVPNANVKILSSQGSVIKETTTSQTGEFQAFPLIFGSYNIE